MQGAEEQFSRSSLRDRAQDTDQPLELCLPEGMGVMESQKTSVELCPTLEQRPVKVSAH
jgi:hypothetical protein